MSVQVFHARTLFACHLHIPGHPSEWPVLRASQAHKHCAADHESLHRWWCGGYSLLTDEKNTPGHQTCKALSPWPAAAVLGGLWSAVSRKMAAVAKDLDQVQEEV